MRQGFVRLTAFLAFAGIVSALHAAPIPVYNTNDAFAGSLRQAVQDAASGDTIVFQIPATGPGYDAVTNSWTITLASAPSLAIAKNLTIDAGSNKIVVTRVTGSGGIFYVTAGTVNISNLTLSNSSSSGLVNSGGTVTVRNCLFRDNKGAGTDPGGIFNFSNGATTNVINCTFFGNTGGAAGTIENVGTLSLTNSTLVGNSAASSVISSFGTTRVRNNIIVGNGSAASGNFISEGYNLVGSITGSSGFGSTGDQIGVTMAQVNLGLLQDNGGPTKTMRPNMPSPAIDQGNRGLDNLSQPVNTDQRGQPRPIDLTTPNAVGGDGSDIGAVEVGAQQTGPTFTVTNTAEHQDVCSNDDCTLLEAISATNGNADMNTINFAPGLRGAITTVLTPSGLVIINPVTIDGPGARILQISGGNTARVFESNANVSMSGLTITGGHVTDNNGAGILVNAGVLTLIDCNVSFNNAVGSTSNGGGIYLNSGATLNLVRTLLRNNQATQFGGGIYSDGVVNGTNCSLTTNLALRGGGIISRFNNGASSVTLRNCTIAYNTSYSTGTATGDGGGGLYAEGGAAQYHLGNTLIADNHSDSIPPTNPDVRGNFTSDGHNFIGTIGFSNLTSGVGDQVGNNASPKDPRLAAVIANNGGPTETIALLSDSTAINAGDNALAPSTDQRGYPRIGVSDIGAFEYGSGLLRVTKIQRNGNDLDLAFTEAVAGSTYRFEQTYELAPASWLQIPSVTDYTPTQTGADEFVFTGVAALPPNQSKVFYRVRLLP